MRVLVTGGAGFIGSHSVDALVEAGHEVAVVDDLSSGNRSFVNPDAEFHERDIRSETLADIFVSFRPSHVLHLAAQMDVRASIENPLYDADVNVLGSINVLQNCVAHKVRSIAFSSTGGAIYGDPANLPATEETPPAPLCPYGVSKLAAEYFFRFYGQAHGLDFMILRYGNVYGPRQNPHGEAGVCAIFSGLMLDGKAPTLYGEGTPLRDYVYVDDVVRANLLGLEHPQCCAVNIASGEGATVRKLYDIIQSETGFKGKPVLAPLRPGEVDRIYLSAERAQAALGWAPQVSLEQGLARTVDFIRRDRKG